MKERINNIRKLQLIDLKHIDFTNYPAQENLPDSLLDFFPNIKTEPLQIPCKNCNTWVLSRLHPHVDVDKIKDVSVKFISYSAFCPKCGEQLLWSELDELNNRNLYDAFRKQKGIISLNDVREIPGKYNIGKRPLSQILGWGELTFTRFYDGDIPSEKYSKQLLDIYENPKTFREILCKNSNMISPASVQKSLRTVNELIGEVIEDICLIECAKYIRTRLEDVSAMALQKLLYYTEAFFYIFYRDDCFTERCVAWQHGPVFTSVYYLNKEGRIQSNAESLHSNYISPDLRKILDVVIKDFGCYSGDKLRDFTHAEPPWRNAWMKAQRGTEIIDYNELHSYFLDVQNKHNINSVEDIKLYPQYMFERCR